MRGGRCASRRPIRGTAANGASFGEKSGWERVNWFDAESRRRRRVAAAARLGRAELVACDRGRVPRRRRARGAVRPVVVREDRRPRAGRVRVPRRHVRQHGRPAGRIGHLHAAAQRPRGHRGRRDARAARERSLPLRHGHGIRLAQPRLAAAAPDRTGSHADDITSSRDVLLPLGPARARHPAAAHEDRSLHEAFPYMRAREIAVGDVPLPRLARDLRGRARLGALLPRRSTASGSRTCSATAGAAHGLRGGGYRAIESMRLEKGYRAWGTDLTPETTPESAGVGFAVRLDKERRSSGRRRCAPSAPPAGRPSGSRASCSTIRARSAWAPSRCASTASCAVASRRAATAVACGAASRSPMCRPRTRWPARAPRSRSSGSGYRPRSWRARSTIRLENASDLDP